MSFDDLTIGQLLGATALSVTAVYIVIAMIERAWENRTASKRRR
jgi:hypothetical protein